MWLTVAPETSVCMCTHNYRVVRVSALQLALCSCGTKGERNRKSKRRSFEANKKKSVILSFRHEKKSTSSTERKNESKERERSRMKELKMLRC